MSFSDVITITGMRESSASAFMAFKISRPVITGIMMSSSTRESVALCVRIMSIVSRPSEAKSTS